ncbi:MAG TPA: CHRD domain-containing protein [Solirubrobacteraceae bacterium]|nr:CHRD domain-containing protein [Solirubrobacteraceae bacterium]
MTRARIAAVLATAAAAAAVLASGSPAASPKLYAFMDGEAETRQGDTDGHARIGFTFDRGARRVCFDLRKFKLETPTRAHIHKGRKDKDGPIVVTLFEKPTGAGRGKVTGCASNVPRTTIDRILARPGDYYANVHTATYPAGSVRGQLTTRKLV